MRLELQRILEENPALEGEVANMPRRVFSGRTHPAPGAKAVFFCYRIPGPDVNGAWSLEAGETRWYLYDLSKQTVRDDVEAIHKVIQSTPETPRHVEMSRESLAEMRGKVEDHIKNDRLKKLQAPAGQKPILITWMELN